MSVRYRRHKPSHVHHRKPGALPLTALSWIWVRTRKGQRWAKPDTFYQLWLEDQWKERR